MNDSETRPAGKLLPLTSIRTDGGTQPRETIDPAVVADYAEALKERTSFPPVVVFHDGTDNWLADGFHRLDAHRLAGRSEIGADVRPGTRRDAVLYAAKANAKHGLRRSNADKRRAVTLLLTDPEWAKWSNNEVARQCSVSSDLVAEVRRYLTESDRCAEPGKPEIRTVNRGGKTFQQNTANIGKATTNKPTAPSKQTDALGRAIEQDDIAAAFSNRKLFKTLMRQMSDLKFEFRKLSTIPGGEWAGRQIQEFDAHVNSAHAAVRFSIPHAICPYCGGAKCTRCKNTGWLPEDQYILVPAEIRKQGGDHAA